MSKFETKPLSKVATTAEEFASMQKEAATNNNIKANLDSNGLPVYDGMKTKFKGFSRQDWERTDDEGRVSTGGYYVAVFENNVSLGLHLFIRTFDILTSEKQQTHIPRLTGGIADSIAANSDISKDGSFKAIADAFTAIGEGEFVVVCNFDFAVANGQKPRKCYSINFASAEDAKKLRKKLAK